MIGYQMVMYSPLWGDDYAVLKDRNVLVPQIAKLLKTPGMKDLRELIVTLLGVGDGATALVQLARVDHSLIELGGQRTISTIDLLNRATTTADETSLFVDPLNFSSTTATPVDKATLH